MIVNVQGPMAAGQPIEWNILDATVVQNNAVCGETNSLLTQSYAVSQ